jgi:type IV pilus assembly protein PilB
MPRSVAGAELSIRRKDGSTLDTGTSGTAKLFREVLRMAIHINASDAHIQPYGTGAVVRNRVDGVLHTTIDLPRKVHDHLVRHVKAISGMDPTRSFVPQDGELSVEVEHKYTDLRLSIVPLDSGERLVMRLLPQSQVKSLDNLQLAAHEMQRMRTMATASAGLILVTGPTGSGKTSLMYAMLAEINTPDINIMTVEQPVEYRLRGASQINVDTRQGLTFALALRSILRQDPDVVMVGEIRDEETATIAAQAALTGHLVLSTVHTLDGLSSLSRMEDLGVTPNTLSNALQAIVAQRLVRKLCLQCRTVRQPQDLSADEQQYAALRAAPAWQSIGCDACNGTGYWGRAPVVEVIEITGQLQTALRAGERDLARLEVLAAATGTRFLSESFADRVDEGTTTVAEVLRVYGRGFFTRLKQHNNLRIAQLAHAAKRQSETDLAIT